MPKVTHANLERDGEKLGLVCRRCACQHFKVIYLKRLPNGAIVRRRECRHCGTRMTTRETIA